MMRIPLFKTALRTTFFLLALAITGQSFGQQNLTFNIENTLVGDTVIAEFRALDFTNILTMQFTLTWDETEMQFEYIDELNLDGLQLNSFGTTYVADGTLTFSWLDPDVTGITFPHCTPLFTVKFLSLNGNVPAITIGNSPTFDEVTDGNANVVPWTQTYFGLNCSEIEGKVFRDLDSDCDWTAGDEGMNNWKVKFENGTHTYYTSTNPDGNYALSLPSGDYTASIVYPGNNIWDSCDPVQNISVDSTQTTFANYPMTALVECPIMTVDLSAPFLRRCFTSAYYVKYCNEGSAVAEDASVVIELDSFLTVVSSTLPWSSADGQTYTFDLGDVPYGECGTFEILVDVSCDAVLGQTHCTSAHVFPDDPCIPSINWDGSDLDITGTCDGDSVRFEIKNIGDDMADPVEFIVIEDDMIHFTSDPIQLLSQQSTHLAVEANGSTWRVEIPETPDNPFSTFATDAIEGCGTNGSGEFSLGFVAQFPQDEQSLAVDVDCQENRGAFDPNDKTGYPKGFCQANYVRADQELEYRIRFQNTGTDTAFNITIVDTLSNFLSPASVRPGSSSHPYEFSLLGEGVVKFTFSNIMLPDSNINEPASHGFVKFTIDQASGNPMGTVIENYASIYFDFNEPIHTNIVRHTIGDNFVEMQGQAGDLSVTGNTSTWWGEPIDSVAMTMTNLCPVYSDLDGNYEFLNIDTATYSLTAFKQNDDIRRKLTVLDMMKTRLHILGVSELNGYQRLAADINKSSSVTTFDLVEMAKTILGIPTAFHPDRWRFVTADTDLNTDISLWHSEYTYDPLDASLADQDFIGVQPGDVIDESMVEKVPVNTEFRLGAAEMTDDTIRIPVTAKEYDDVWAFQYALKWDADVMEMTDIEKGTLEIFTHDFNAPAGEGKAALYYVLKLGENGTFTEDETLFTLVFKALAPNGSTTALELDESEIPLQVVVDTCKLANPSVTSTDVVLETTSVVEFEETGLQVKIAPNPVRHGQPIQLEVVSEQAQALTLHLYDLSGAAVMTNAALNAPAGRSFHNMKKPMSKGIYLMKIMDGTGKEMTAKVVVF